MSDSILNFDDVEDYRFDPFTEIITPKLIGYGVNLPETRTIPNTSPYQIKLFESPQENIPSTTRITLVVGGAELTEVSKTTTPASLKYRVNYDEEGNGIVEFNSAQKGLQIEIQYYGLGTLMQKQTLATKLEASFTITLAANDSEASSKESADYILGAGQDAGLMINNLIAGLGANGGEIKLFEGTYSVITNILPDDNIKITGSGGATILERAAAIQRVIYINTKSNVILSSFKIDGKKGTYAGNRDGIEETGSSYIKYSNIQSYQNDRYGFVGCNNLINCFAIENDSDGFNTGDYLTNCKSISSGTNGFNTCDYLTNNESENNAAHGYILCFNVTTCKSKSNGINGFMQCKYMSSCDAASNTADGYQTCENVVGSYATDNVNGFDGSQPMQTNYSTGNSGANYNNSFADRAGTQATADTAAGGYNG